MPKNYYVRLLGQGKSDQIWEIDEREAILLGIESPQRGPGVYFAREDFDTIWEAIKNKAPWFDAETKPFIRLGTDPRTYHPRIARPLSYYDQKYMVSPNFESESAAIALGIGQATALMRRLDLICQIVHPDAKNFGVFGHEIRNLLILAATEVEAHWRGVLIANGSTKERFNTSDYVRLLEPMRLAEYAVSFTNFPWIDPVKPFENWHKDQPTKSLTWYDAYNAVKHDREKSFELARLDHALCAVSACVAMLVAQFTRSIGLGGRSDLSYYFGLPNVPRWEASEIYTSLGEGDLDWTAIPHKNLSK